MTIAEKIIDQYGTVSHYARKKDINYGSLRQVLYNNGTSKPVVDQLKKDGFLPKNWKREKKADEAA